MGRIIISGTAVAMLTVAAASPAAAQEKRPQALTQVIACQGLSDAAARLACYDANVAALDKAERNRDVVVVDRTEIRKARKTLFGLNLPDFSLFGRDNKEGAEEEGVTRIDSTLAGATQGADDRWTLILEDGARWVQIDTRDVPRSPRKGMPIVIRRAAMGSFMANIDKQIAIRVRRAN